MPTAPFFAIYNVGPYTFAPYKVMWAEQSQQFKAAVVASGDVPLIGSRPYVPDHKVFFVAFDDELSAYYLCGLLTASLVREFVESHNISIQVGNVFKHMRLPPFNKQEQTHQKLALLTKSVHDIHSYPTRPTALAHVQSIADDIILKAGIR